MNEECFYLGVKALILNPEEKVLLLKRCHPLKGVYWDIPGGRLQKGESQTETLLREVREETGLNNISKVHPLMMSLTDIRIPGPTGDFGLIFSIFLIKITEAFIPILSNEHVDFEWCFFPDAAEKLKEQYPSQFIKFLESQERPISGHLLLPLQLLNDSL